MSDHQITRLAAQRNTEGLLLNPPKCVGFSVFELNKVKAFDFYYIYTLIKYEHKSIVKSFTINHRFVYEFSMEVIHEDFWRSRKLFDLSKCSNYFNKVF